LLIEVVLLVENTSNGLNEKVIHPINRNSYINNVKARIDAMKLETQLQLKRKKKGLDDNL